MPVPPSPLYPQHSGDDLHQRARSYCCLLTHLKAVRKQWTPGLHPPKNDVAVQR